MYNLSQEDYSKNGMQTRVWGPAGWIFLHSIAQNYPQEPTIEQKEHYRSFFRLVGTVLPCRYCRESYQQFINEPDTRLDDNVMRDRTTFTKWLYDIHNKVNKKLDVQEQISFKEVTDKYESFRSKCTKSAPVHLEKAVHGCTNPSKNGSLRKKCEIKIVDVDENGNRVASFGKSKPIKLVSIKRSTKSGKKYTATFKIGDKTKTIHFGSAGMRDYTILSSKKSKNAKQVRSRYIFRHHKDLQTGNPMRAGYLSMFVLWNKPSLKASISDYRSRLNTYNKTGKFPKNITGYNSPGKKSKYQ